jgi:O-antigen ligase
MSRRGARSSVSPRPAALARRSGESPSPGAAPDGSTEVAASTARLGERLRRLALGLLAALITARAYWPGELDLKKGPSTCLGWVLALMLVAGLGLAASLFSGRFRFRWSWPDIAIVALMFLVGLSSTRGVDRRVAINLAWEWAGLGFAYILTRNLPRTRGESTVLAGALVATAVAVSAYGMYQDRVEIPELRAQFLRNPQRMLQAAEVPPEPRQIQAFKDRLLGSNEVFSTFGLANSLAGFLVGPLVLAVAMCIENLAIRQAKASRWVVLGLAVPPLLCLLACLVLTKSRSAYLGLFAAVLVLAWQSRRRVPVRLLIGAGIAGLAVVIVLAAAGLAAGRLDREVLTQSPMSMRYRWEYWQGAWGVITEGASSLGGAVAAPTFWAGVGPGNFGTHYLRYKLPQASEEIQDPHNLLLEVWATAGFWAVLALMAALGLGLRDLLGPARAPANQGEEEGRRRSVPRETTLVSREADADEPPKGLGWLAVSAGLGLVMALVLGGMNLFEGDLFVRWLILAASWLAAALLGQGLWRRAPIPAPAMGAAVLAVVINLLAAGGIGFTTVALSLWILMALGLNLREDRACGRLNEAETRLPGFGLAILWAALVGSFAGAIGPFWRSEAAIARADEALRHQPPDFERAAAAYETAKREDLYSARPWLGEAYLQLLVWESHGAKPSDLRWKTIPVLLLKAASPPRNPDAWTLHSERAKVTRDLLAKVGPSLSPRDVLPLQASVVEATRTASRLYPTNATLHARLAEASAEMSMFQDAVTEAREALRLDDITPHADKKLVDTTRNRLKAKLPAWEEKAAQFKVEVK